MSTRGFVAARSGTRGAPNEVARTVEETLSSASASERLLLLKYRELARSHCKRILDRLFADFTGLHYQLVWTRAGDSGSVVLPTASSAWCRFGRAARCSGGRACGERQLTFTSQTQSGHHFTCPLGVQNYWIPIRLRGAVLGIAGLQAFDRGSTRSGSKLLRGARAPHRRESPKVAPNTFAHASRFLRFIIAHVETATLSDLRKADLTTAGRAVVALEREQARLRQVLGRYVAAPPEVATAARPGAESRASQTVRGLLRRLQLEYSQPLTLRACARDSGMNAAYLSALFSRTMGVSFKAYLTELRLQKARELLSDPARTVADVGFATGYSSAERFRAAFKQAHGLCPSQWREAMHAPPGPVSDLQSI